MKLERDNEGRMFSVAGGQRTEVEPRACFPWSRPGAFVSLRDREDLEVALIEDVASLDAASRAALEATLARCSFVFEVCAVRVVEQHFELRLWEVETAQGPRRFQTKLDQWPEALPQGGYLLRDVGGDLYRFPAPEQLDPKSRRLLAAFVD